MGGSSGCIGAYLNGFRSPLLKENLELSGLCGVAPIASKGATGFTRISLRMLLIFGAGLANILCKFDDIVEDPEEDDDDCEGIPPPAYDPLWLIDP